MAAFVLYLCLACFILFPQALWSPDEGAKFLQLQSLRIENGRLAQDIAYPGREIDPHLHFAQTDSQWGLIRVRDGAQYFHRLPIFPALSFPFFYLFGMYGLYLLPALCGALLGAFALGLLQPKDRRPMMWVLMTIGSPILIYATNFWEHTLASCLALAGAWLALRIGPIKHRAPIRQILGWVAVGLLSGIAIFMRLEIVFFVLALFFSCWWLMREGRWGVFWACTPLVVAGLIYIPLHLVAFGEAMPEHAGFLFLPFRYLRAEGWRVIPDLLIGPAQHEAIESGFLGQLWAAAAVVALAYSIGYQTSRVVLALRWIALAITACIAAIFLFTSTPYRSAHGFLFTTPWAILGICRAYEVWQRGDRRAQIVVLTAMLGLAGYVVALVGLRGATPHGGLQWGMRFAITFYPLLALIAAWDLGKKRHEVKTLIIVSALICLGIGFQVRGLGVIWLDKQIHVTLNEAILSTPEQVILTDLWWMPFNAAPVYQKKALFIITTPNELKEWLDLAATKQVEEIAVITLDKEWLNEAAQLTDLYHLQLIEASRLDNFHLFRIHVHSK